MRRLLPILLLAAALPAAPAVQAQDVAIALTHARSVRDGSAQFGEKAQVNALRLEVPFGRWVPFGSVAVAQEMERPICVPDCGRDGTLYMTTLGVDYRLRDARPWILVPYVGGGPEMLIWSGGATEIMPHAHVGGDLFLNQAVAFRLELQTTGMHTALSAGVRIGL